MRKVLATVAFLTVMLAGLPAAQADSAGWIAVCSQSHSGQDDPIVFPGQPGASHLHDFFGNRTTGANSTYQSMTAGGTSCKDLGDTAGYWVPALYQNGVKVDPNVKAPVTGRTPKQKFYYRKYGTGPVQAFPPGFAMVLGNSKATTPAENPLLGTGSSHIYWGCADNSGDEGAVPRDCAVGVISLHFEFPTCWDGTYMPFVNEVPQMKYPKSGVCPAGYIALPRLIERYEYPVGPVTGTITLASGPDFTVHADFVNTWNQSRLETLVATCLNANKDCGSL